ncbi:MAG: beta-lactamase family protein [Chloroflexi bacterium]|nr:beta-lactamase family protein [Chloroflexota bacterium]OJV86854.1 MAG: hypothetical protein BGO39_13590 [Chloroflexi bacterium 54-19]
MTATETVGNTKFAELGQVVTEALERLGVPGAAVGVFYEGVEYTAGFGVTNINHPLPVDDQTLFQIASISKTFNATAAMRLVEQGKLDLDTPLKTYLPDLKLSDPEANEKATLRHVYNHNGGWAGDYFGDFGRGDDALAKNVAGMADLPQWTPLGTTYSYNNAGYALAGRAIEVVTGKTYEQAVRDLVLDPLGLDHTFYFPEEAIVHRFAVGHQVYFDDTPTDVKQPWALSRTSAPLGGLTTNVKDLLRYAQFQMGDGSWQTPDGETVQLLKPETMKLMQAKQAPGPTKNDWVGISWMIHQAGEVYLIGHSGASNGQMSLLQIAPERKFAITVVTNATSGTNLCGEVAKWAFENYLDVPAAEVEYLQLDSDEFGAYTGEYRAILSRVAIELKDGELYLQSTSQGGFPKPDSPATPTPPPVRLAFTSPDEAMMLDFPFKGGIIAFIRNEAGEIEWVRFGGRIHKKQ